jgi:hypothetical protein
MRIVKKPTRVLPKLGEHGTNTTHPILIISCDDGCDYTLAQLAKKIGMNTQKLVYQLRALGWKHPQVLDAKFGKLPPPPQNRGNDQWKKLSDHSRHHRLAKIVRAGNLERRGAKPQREDV